MVMVIDGVGGNGDVVVVVVIDGDSD